MSWRSTGRSSQTVDASDLSSQSRIPEVFATDRRPEAVHPVEAVDTEIVGVEGLDAVDLVVRERDLGGSGPLRNVGLRPEGGGHCRYFLVAQQVGNRGLSHRSFGTPIRAAFEEPQRFELFPARLVPLVRAEATMVALTEFGFGSDLLVE